ncbi:MAG: hypothetical protein MUP21_09940 [Dehalococcoidia bacterium]|nr:hypothetical protein [Dehalococcoidia bacterium]
MARFGLLAPSLTSLRLDGKPLQKSGGIYVVLRSRDLSFITTSPLARLSASKISHGDQTEEISPQTVKLAQMTRGKTAERP